MDRIRQAINRWTHGEDWRTWVAHSLIALLITTIAALIAWAAGAAEPLIVGVGVSIGYYLIRELEQILYAYVGHKPIKWLDGLGDVAIPAAVVLALGFALEAIV